MEITRNIGPGIFIDADEKVINYNGWNYYRACDDVVASLSDGGISWCVKRDGHPGDIHEDYEGRTRKDGDGLCGVLPGPGEEFVPAYGTLNVEPCKLPKNHLPNQHSWMVTNDVV